MVEINVCTDCLQIASEAPIEGAALFEILLAQRSRNRNGLLQSIYRQNPADRSPLERAGQFCEFAALHNAAPIPRRSSSMRLPDIRGAVVSTVDRHAKVSTSSQRSPVGRSTALIRHGG